MINYLLLSLLALIVGMAFIVRFFPDLVLDIFKPQRNVAKSYRYNRRQFFMTKAENECYKALVQAVGSEFFVFAQVHLPTIIDERIKGQSWRASRAHVNRKSVDFVLCDKEYISPKLAIELDDWSHARQDRQDRDREVERILKDANMPLLRITNTDNLLSKINDKLNSVPH